MIAISVSKKFNKKEVSVTPTEGKEFGREKKRDKNPECTHTHRETGTRTLLLDIMIDNKNGKFFLRLI